ncbi:hypothetical protein ScPMuIL_011107 [Solemya velum]
MDALLDVGEYLKPRGRVPEDVFFREVLDTDAGMNGEILNRATRNKRQAVDPQYAVSARCMNHTLVYLSALLSREQWAMRMFDAYGKVPSGLLDGNLLWLGSYDECRNITYLGPEKKKDNFNDTFTGSYCKAIIPLENYTNGLPSPFASQFHITLGLCLPSSCTNDDVAPLLNSMIPTIPVDLNNYKIERTICDDKYLPYSDTAIGVFVVLGVLASLLVVGTAYDAIAIQWPAMKDAHSFDTLDANDEILLKQSEISQYSYGSYSCYIRVKSELYVFLVGILKYYIKQANNYTVRFFTDMLGKILLSFSVYTNTQKILSSRQATGSLGAVNGIRFLTLTWVILGHVHTNIQGMGANAEEYYSHLKRWSYQAVVNATVSVDTFFVLSGLLVAYLVLREKERNKGRINWLLFYFHRYWRLTPPYMLVLMVYVPLFQYWSNGPMWPQTGITRDYCKTTWWTNLIYVNNLVRVENMCMAWSWYLADDMQFYIISPLLFMPLYYFGKFGAIVGGLFIAGSAVGSGVVSWNYRMVPNIISDDITPSKYMDFFNNYYIKPYCRIGPYVMGVFTGYVLYKYQCRPRLKRVYVVLGWILATVCCLSVLYGLYPEMNGHPLTPEVAAVYNALARTAWGVGISWLIFACASGYGGFVNDLLSWEGFVPLSRLTYCAYLVHPIVIATGSYSQRTSSYVTEVDLSYNFVANVILTYGCAFLTSLVFEAPMIRFPPLPNPTDWDLMALGEWNKDLRNIMERLTFITILLCPFFPVSFCRNLVKDSNIYDSVLADGQVTNWASVDISRNEHNVSEQCFNDTRTLLTAISKRELWALRMVDAMGKPSSGIFDGNVQWLGEYDECLRVKSEQQEDITPATVFHGKYCKIWVPATGPNGSSVLPPLPVPAMLNLPDAFVHLSECLVHSSRRSVHLSRCSVHPSGRSVYQSRRLIHFSGRLIFFWTVGSLFHALSILPVAWSTHQGARPTLSDAWSLFPDACPARPDTWFSISHLVQQSGCLTFLPDGWSTLQHACSKSKCIIHLSRQSARKDKQVDPSYVVNVNQNCSQSIIKAKRVTPLTKTELTTGPISFIIGLCVPSSCNGDDVVELVNKGLVIIPLPNTTQVSLSICQNPRPELDTKAIIALAICGVFGLLMLMGTVYDVVCAHKVSTADRIQDARGLAVSDDGSVRTTSSQISDDDEKRALLGERKSRNIRHMYSHGMDTLYRQTLNGYTHIYIQTLLEKILESFSVYSNGKQILSTNQSSATLRVVHGVRFISMTWVILGHVYSSLMAESANLVPYYSDAMRRWTFQAISNATFSVDTFFALSGLLVTYLTLREMWVNNGRLNWAMYYFHRFWRLTPVYMLVLMIDVTLFPYMGNGPVWSESGIEMNYCRDTWWTNLLYVNNLVKSREMCFAWSWYLANDMQFYIVSPLIIIALYHSKLIGSIVGSVFLIATLISAGVISKLNDFKASLFTAQAMAGDTNDYFNTFYIKPYCRMGPYIVGMFTGFALYKTNCNVIIDKKVNLLCWAIAAVCCLSTLYGLYDDANGEPLSTDVAALYNAVSRTVWSIGVCWVVFACATGYGGFVNNLLSWKAAIPLSRLTYCAYLVHPLVIVWYIQRRRTLTYMDDVDIVHQYLANTVITYAVALVVSLAFETPMMRIEKAIFRKKKFS